MTRLLTMVLLAAVLSGLPAPPVEAGVGDDAFAKGRELLSQGDFPKALDSFAAAARADRNNRQYLREYALLRRVVELRRQLEAENDPQRWAYIARSLHAYYVGEGLYDEALALNRRMHARLKDASSAILLAETALAVNDPAEAADVLGGLAPDQSTPTVQALLGVALARMGLGDEARQLAAELSLPDNPGPRTLYTAARLRAMTSDPEAAVHDGKGLSGAVIRLAGSNYGMSQGNGLDGVYNPGFGANNGICWVNAKVRLADLTDGTSNTLAFAESLRGPCDSPGTASTPDVQVYRAKASCNLARVDGPVDAQTVIAAASGWDGMRLSTWLRAGAPAGPLLNGRLSPNSPVPDLVYGSEKATAARSRHPGGVNACFADGSVRFVDQTIALETWWNLGLPQDGNVLKDF